MHVRYSILAVPALALFAGGCSGGGSSPGPQSSATPAPILVPGSVSQYTGTDTTTHVYASPTGSQTNYTAGYAFKSTRSVETAAAGSPASIDVNSVTTYTTTQDPGTGVTLSSVTGDAFDNQVAVNGGTSIQEVAAKNVSVGIDESAGASGGGPFTKTTTTSTAYTSPQINGVYPLVTGAVMNEPIGRSVTTSATDANGGVSDTATTFDLSSQNTVNADGSYTLVQQLSNGETQTTTENANGSGTIVASGPLYTLNDTIGVPTNPGSGYVIPVTVDRQNATLGATPAPTATTVPYSAADWYNGNALPIAPFQTNVVTIKGPASSLPSACASAISLPGEYERDTSASTLNIDASYSTTTQQSFEANGTPACVLRTVTTQNYALTTGALSQTVTENYVEILTSTTTPSTNALRRI